MKKLFSRILEPKLPLIAKVILSLFAICLSWTSVHSQINSTSPSSRCGEGTVVLRATATTGTITWYDVPFYGTAVGIGAVFTTPSLPVTKTYYVDALDASGCSLNANKARVTVIATVSAGTIQSNIFYASNTFCKSLSGDMQVTRTGTAGGVFSVSPTGLTINTTTGAITPSTSTNDTYTVTYTITDPAEGCVEAPAQAIITITTAPITPTIAYGGSPWCSSQSTISVSQTGVTGGTYSAYPAGLTINANNGTITPATSNTGTYTVTYFVSGAGGCAPQAATAEVTILKLPTAAIFYSTPFTKNQTNQLATLTGTAVYTGGTYSYTGAGTLSLNASTGAIDPSASTAGAYTVIYTLPAISPCGSVTTQTNITIYALPTAAIAGTTSVCKNSSEPLITFTGADGATPYTFTYQINGSSSQTVTTTGINTDVTVAEPTLLAGTYIYTLLSVTDATGSTKPYVADNTAIITVTTPQSAAFAYSGSPYCSDAVNPTPTFLDGGIAGTFTASSTDLKFANAATGEINMTTSVAGTYTVTNTLPATGGCGIITATTPVTITKKPVATFSYAKSTYCQVETNPIPTLEVGSTLGTYSSSAGLVFSNLATGEIDLLNTIPGTYTITNTIIAADGCSIVTASFEVTITSQVEISIPEFTIVGESTIRCQKAETISGRYIAAATNSTNIAYSLDALSIAGGNTINSSTGALTYAGTWSGTTTITATASASCANSKVATHTVTIHPSVVIGTPTYTLGSTSVRCQGMNSVTYGATATNAASYIYTLDANSETNGNRINIITGQVDWDAEWFGTSVITVTATADCNDGVSATHTITTNPLPVCSISGSNSVLYASTNTYSGTADMSTYAWTISGNGAIQGAANNQSVSAKATAAGSYTLTSTITNSNGCVSTCQQVVTVNKVELTVTGASVSTKTYDGNTDATIVNAALSGIVNSDVISLDNALIGTFDNANIGTAKAVTTAMTISGSGSTNYSLTQPTLTGNITAKEITVTGASITTKTYDGNTTATIVGATLSGKVGTEDVSLANETTGTFNNANVGASKAVTTSMTLTGDASGNYSLTQPTITGEITAKELTVTSASVTTKIYDGSDAATITGATLNGKVGTEDVSLANETTGTFDNANVGTGKTVTTSMTLTGDASGNYSLTQPTLTGNITAKELTVTGASVTSKTYDGNTTSTIVDATLSGKVGTEDVSLANETTGTFNNANVGTSKAVTTAMILSGTAIGNYILTQPTITGEITAKELTVTGASVTTKTYDGNTTATIVGATLSGKVGTEDVSLANETIGTFDNANVGTGKIVTTSMTLTGDASGNYSLTQPVLTGDIINL